MPLIQAIALPKDPSVGGGNTPAWLLNSLSNPAQSGILAAAPLTQILGLDFSWGHNWRESCCYTFEIRKDRVLNWCSLHVYIVMLRKLDEGAEVIQPTEGASWTFKVPSTFELPREPHIFHFLLLKMKQNPDADRGFREFASILDTKQKAGLWPGRLLHAGTLEPRKNTLGYTNVMLMAFESNKGLKKYMVDHTPDGMRVLVPHMAIEPVKGGSFVADLVLPAAEERLRLGQAGKL